MEEELVVCSDTPHLSMVYKIVQIESKGVLKFSENIFKATLPGKKEIYRVEGRSKQGHYIADVIALPGEEIQRLDAIKVVSITGSQERYVIIPHKIYKITKSINVMSEYIEEDLQLNNGR